METIFNGLIESDHPLETKKLVLEHLMKAASRLTDQDAKLLTRSASCWSMQGLESLRREVGREIVFRLHRDRGPAFLWSVLEEGWQSRRLPDMLAALHVLLLPSSNTSIWTVSLEQMIEAMAMALQQAEEDREASLELLAVLGHALVASCRLNPLVEEGGEEASDLLLRFTRAMLLALSSHRTPASAPHVLFPPSPLLDEDWPFIPRDLMQQARALGAGESLCVVRALTYLRCLWEHPQAGEGFLSYIMKHTMSCYMTSDQPPSCALSLVLCLCPQDLVDKAADYFSTLECDQSQVSSALDRLLRLAPSPPLTRWVGALFLGCYKRGWTRVVSDALASSSLQLLAALRDPLTSSSALDVLAPALLGDGASYDNFSPLFDRLARMLEEEAINLEPDNTASSSSSSPSPFPFSFSSSSSSFPSAEGLGIALVGLDMPQRQQRGMAQVYASVERRRDEAPRCLYMEVTNFMPRGREEKEVKEEGRSRECTRVAEDCITPRRHAKTQPIQVNSLHEEMAMGLSVPLFEPGEHLLQVSIYAVVDDVVQECFRCPPCPLIVGDFEEERVHCKRRQPAASSPAASSPPLTRGVRELLVVLEGMWRVHGKEDKLRAFLDRYGVAVTEEEVSAMLQRTALIFGRGAGGGARGGGSQTPEARAMLRGIANVGNSCYMSAFLQVLFHAQDFRRLVLSPRAAELSERPRRSSERDGEEGGKRERLHAAAVTLSLRGIFLELEASTAQYVSPEGLVASLQERFPRGEQHDSCEFGRHLLACVETCFKKHEEQEAEGERDSTTDSKGESIRSEHVNPSRLFEGEVASYIRCDACRTIKRNLETFWDLSVPLVGKEGNKQFMKVSELIEDSMNEERLSGSDQYHCETCGRMSDASKHSEITAAPHYLQVTLLRFLPLSGAKDCSLVDLSETLSLPSTSCPVRYRLLALIAHVGASIHHGHYVAYARARPRPRAPEVWCRFDDEEVKISSWEGFRGGDRLETPYLLLYRKERQEE